jgi:hypothetical protein
MITVWKWRCEGCKTEIAYRDGESARRVLLRSG